MEIEATRLIDKVPDALTLSRGIISIILLLFIPINYINALLFVILYIIAWLTDTLDGKIARKLEIKGKLAEWDYYLDTLLQFTLVAYGTFIGSLPVIFFLIWLLAGVVLSLITRNKAVVNLMGALGLIIHLVFMYFYNEILFWILISFWLFLFFTGLPRFIERLHEIEGDLSKLKKEKEKS